MNCAKHIKKQRGSALFIILIGVVLFAALSYTVAQMMRGGNPSIITEEKARLYADEALNYARAMRQAVQNLRINGCPALDISFEATGLTGYAHSPVVADVCKVFDEYGGAVNYLVPAADWLDMNRTPAPPLRGQWYFMANVCVPRIGDAGTNCHSDSVDNEPLIAALPFVRREVCIQINKMVNVTNPGDNPPPLTIGGTLAFTKFTGSQSSAASIDTGGKMAGCYEGDGMVLPSGTYHFFQILLPR